MTKTIIASMALIAVSSTAGLTQEYIGGEITISFSVFTEDIQLNKTDLGLSREYALSDRFSAQADLTYKAFDEALTENFGVLTLHGVYKTEANLSIGAFVGYEIAQDFNTAHYGIEAAYEAEKLSVEAYVAGYSEDGLDLSYGLRAKYDIAPQISADLSFDRLDATDGSDSAVFRRIALRGTYKTATGPSFFAEYGNLRASFGSLSGSEPFFGIGATFDIGGKGAATFSRRSVTTALPGL